MHYHMSEMFNTNDELQIAIDLHFNCLLHAITALVSDPHFTGSVNSMIVTANSAEVVFTNSMGESFIVSVRECGCSIGEQYLRTADSRAAAPFN